MNLKFAKNWSRMVSSPLVKHMYRLLCTFYWSLLNDIFYTAPLCQYFQMFWNFFRNSKYFGITCFFRVKDWEHFCDQDSSIVQAFNYLEVATARWNFLLSLMLAMFLDLFRNSKYFSENLPFFLNFRHRYSFIVPSP